MCIALHFQIATFSNLQIINRASHLIFKLHIFKSSNPSGFYCGLMKSFAPNVHRTSFSNHQIIKSSNSQSCIAPHFQIFKLPHFQIVKLHIFKSSNQPHFPPNTFFKISLILAAGSFLILVSSCATSMNSPSVALVVT